MLQIDFTARGIDNSDAKIGRLLHHEVKLGESASWVRSDREGFGDVVAWRDRVRLEIDHKLRGKIPVIVFITATIVIHRINDGIQSIWHLRGVRCGLIIEFPGGTTIDKWLRR